LHRLSFVYVRRSPPRLLQCRVINIKGNSYHLKNYNQQIKEEKSK